MHARTLLAGLATTAVALSGVALSAGSASAAWAVQPDDTSFTPVSADVIGVGSDTSQHAVKLLAEAWNAQSPAPAYKLSTYAATGGGDVQLPGKLLTRPNGSGQGKNMLRTAGGEAEVDYARSSSAVSDTEFNDGLRAFPFAADSLQMVVRSAAPSNAPTSITPMQIVGIYEGTINNWSEIDASKSGEIVAMIPQDGSGTRKFFTDTLSAIKGSAVNLASDLQQVQEHDDSQIVLDANAIAPFSVGRAGLTGGTLRLLSGWKADRALYNVVRNTDLVDPTKGARLQALFGEDGFFCSTAARDYIAEAGFQQLATPANGGGACGTLVQTTSNFLLNEQVVTTTKLAISSTTAGAAKLTATVTGASAPQGTVTFYNGASVLKANVGLISGQATTTVSGLKPGAVSYRAVFTPAEGSKFDASEATASGVVKTASKIAAKFPKSVKAGKKVTGTVTVTLTGVSTKATGKVTVKLGSKTVASGNLKSGKVTLTLKKLKAGKANKLKAVYAGDSTAVGATKTFTVKVAKAKKK